ncbi:VOC family protein [Bacillus timonensis]|nr:VOC family protein [Bacillus timonensis]
MASTFHQSPNTYVRHVHINVTDIQRSLSFYQDIIGFQILSQSDDQAILSADGLSPLLTIQQPKALEPKQNRTTGLYHFALLLPTRHDLATFIQHIAKKRYRIQGGSHHGISEALYLADPDGNGIEVYADTPTSTWRWEDDRLALQSEPLDIEELLQVAKGQQWNGLPTDTIMGHIHLHVANLDEVDKFYQQGLGFTLVSQLSKQAHFYATGNYHHHIGVNVWNGVGAPKPSENSVGLVYYDVVFPSEQKREKMINNLKALGYPVREDAQQHFTEDPSGNVIRLIIE